MSLTVRKEVTAKTISKLDDQGFIAMKMEARVALVVSICAAVFSISSHAATKYWMGPSCSSDWSSSCWSSTQGGVSDSLGQPQSADDVYLYESSVTNYWEFINYSNSNNGTVLNSLHVDGVGFFSPVLVQGQGSSLTSVNEYIGENGTGGLWQQGGTHTVAGALTLGQNAGSRGIDEIDSGILSAQNEIIGEAGLGEIYQGAFNFGYGPTANTISNTLTLGHQSGSSGAYTLSQGTVSARNELVGDAGSGQFNQQGGINTVGDTLTLGHEFGGYGAYNLFDGVLTALNEVVGDAGEGVFTQGQNNYGYGATTNPVNSVNGTLTLGKQAGGKGTYNLLSGTLSAQQQIIGDAGTGTFNQSGGTNAVSGSLILAQQAGSHGIYNLLDGVLTAVNEVVGDAGEGTFTQGQNNYGYGSTNPTNSVNGTLTLGKQAGGSGAYNLVSGTLTAQQQVIGDAGNGTFNQTGGSNIVSGALVLGQQARSLGIYNLVDGALVALNEVIGDGGTGTFTQGNNYGYGATNPSNTVTGTLTLGKQIGSHGTYNLISGSLTALHEIIGDAGEGVLHQTGGNNTVNGTLTVGRQIGSTGKYTLDGGELTTAQIIIGDAGSGTFEQSGGVHSANNIVLGKQSTGTGAYVLKGGELNVHGNIERGAGAGSVSISGGAVNFDAGNHVVSVDKVELSNSGVMNLADNANATFEGSVKHYGQEIHIGANGNAIFNGEFEGAGAITGSGTATFNNIFKPGSGPITFTVAGNMVLGSNSTTLLELAGTDRGAQYDAINVGGTLSLGGQLQLSSLTGFTPHLGDTFDLFEAENITGHFDLLTLFALGSGLTWEVDYLNDAIGSIDVVRLSVVSSVPLPASFWLMQLSLSGLVAAARIRKRLH